MLRRCAATLRIERWFALGAMVLGCGPSDGDVGTLAVADAARAPTFEEPFADPGLPWSTRAPVLGGSVAVGIEFAAATDGRVARLVFPGHAEYGATERAGPAYRTEVISPRRFGFGTHRSRVSFGSCSATQEVVHAVLGYFGDGEDHNGNGITDEIEIDFQVLCGQSNLAYLTVFTDAQSSQVFRKLSHVVDFATGRYYDTPRDDEDTFALSGTDGALAIPNLFQAGPFYELGFEWHEGSIRFFLDLGNDERTIWTLADPSHVPTAPVQVVYNLWHPDSHWFPRDGQAAYPDRDVTMLIDWFRYDAE